MRPSRFAASGTALLIGAAALGWSGTASARTKVIYSFPTPQTGFGNVNATDAAGNLYGVAVQGGLGYGTILELIPPATAGAPWTEQTLYRFPSAATGYPSGLTRDAAGNLYGVTSGDGLGQPKSNTVWELIPPAVLGGTWTYSLLYTFPAGADLCGDLVRDGAGVLYGTTFAGGALHGGSVFSLAPPPPGGLAWTETDLHTFAVGKHGRYLDPSCPLTLSAGGRVLYGVTRFGPGGGNVFRLLRQASGWVYQRIGLPPGGTDAPTDLNGGLVADANGNLFGTSAEGGAHFDGTVFELSPPSSGQTVWTEQTLHSFDGRDGQQPTGGLAASRSVTALFGTAFGGGSKGYGVAFRLDPPASGLGQWSYTALHDFDGGPRGQAPFGPVGALVFGHTHKLYGITVGGGANRHGTVFSQTPDFPQTAQ